MDFSSFQKTLAQNKVYDAWQYVQSLNETLAYMNMSAELLEKVYAHRIAVLESSAQGILRTAVETGKASVTEETLRATHLDIADFELNDAVFLKKTSLEFFHYARPVSYTHLRAHETDSYLVCRLLLEKKKK